MAETGKYKRIAVVHKPTDDMPLLLRQLRDTYPQHEFVGRSSVTVNDGISELADCDLILTVGGDGTLLSVVNLAVETRLPVLGFNRGRVGYLCELHGDDAIAQLAPYLAGRAHRDERTLLILKYDGQDIYALNDFILIRGLKLKVSQFDVTIGGRAFRSYRADGVIVATATGSTAYAHSLDAPIMDPISDHILLKPISSMNDPHGALVVGEKIEIKINQPKQEHILYADGRRIAKVDCMTVETAKPKLTLLRRRPVEERWRQAS